MTNLKKSKTTINVGVDVGKEYLDIYIHIDSKYIFKINLKINDAA